MNNEITSITTFTGQGDTFPSRYSSPSAGKREGIMKLTKDNLGKSYFDSAVKGDIVAITFQNMNRGVLTGKVDICSNAGEPERMYEVDGIGEVWEWCLVWISKAEGK